MLAILKLGGKLTLSCRIRMLVFLCLTALLCLTAGLLGNYLLYGEGSFQPLALAVVDEDNTFESRLLLNYLDDLKDYEELVAFLRVEGPEARRLLEEGKVTAVVTIPAGFMSGVIDGSNDPFRVLLDGRSPLRADLMRLFAGSYTDMLRSGQMGVYTALDGVTVWNPEGHKEMLRLSNLRYIGAVLSRGELLEMKPVTATGPVSVGLYYGVAAFVFLLLLGSVLFLDVWAAASARPILLGLASKGRNPLQTGLLFSLSASIPFGVACLLLGSVAFLLCQMAGIAFPLSGWLLLCLPLLILTAGSFLFASSRLFGTSAAGGTAVFLLSLLGLFLSGGILPQSYLSPLLQRLGSLTPHYWLCRLLTEGLTGALSIPTTVGCLLWVLLLTAIGVAHVWYSSQVRRLP